MCTKARAPLNSENVESMILYLIKMYAAKVLAMIFSVYVSGVRCNGPEM